MLLLGAPGQRNYSELKIKYKFTSISSFLIHSVFVPCFS